MNIVIKSSAVQVVGMGPINTVIVTIPAGSLTGYTTRRNDGVWEASSQHPAHQSWAHSARAEGESEKAAIEAWIAGNK